MIKIKVERLVSRIAYNTVAVYFMYIGIVGTEPCVQKYICPKRLRVAVFAIFLAVLYIKC